MIEQAIAQHAELLLLTSRIDLPVREPFSRTLAMALITRREMEYLLGVAEELGIASARLDAVRRALAERDREYAAALERVGAACVRQAMVQELELKVTDYQQRLDGLVRDRETFAPEEYEQFEMEEEADNHVTLMRRSVIEYLLDELGDCAETRAARARLAPADALLRARGVELYGPLIQAGLFESMRKHSPEPPSHWWYHLDELDPDATTGGGEGS